MSSKLISSRPDPNHCYKIFYISTEKRGTKRITDSIRVIPSPIGGGVLVLAQTTQREAKEEKEIRWEKEDGVANKVLDSLMCEGVGVTDVTLLLIDGL